MNESDQQMLDRYLDGLLGDDERARFEQQLTADPELARAADLQAQLDSRLRDLLVPPVVASDQIRQWIAAGTRTDGDPSARVGEKRAEAAAPTDAVSVPRGASWRSARGLGWAAVVATVAATLLGLLAAWSGWRGPMIEPYFEPRSLAAIYREAVADGFEPYYYCEDDERFRMTFAKRQQQALELMPMPSDRRMVGLSYLGGFSRDTTAILCYKHEHPVLVFVDRREEDRQGLAEPDPGEGLVVHRAELGDLVAYEVSPLDESTILPYLRLP